MSTSLFKPETFGLTESRTMAGPGPAARRVSERSNPRFRQAMLEAREILHRAWGGDRLAMHQVNEAITTSDLFKSAAGAVMDREMLADYERTSGGVWSQFASETKVKDFKPKTLTELTSNTGGLPSVPEHSNYPINNTTAFERQVQVGKFGEQHGYTFEARINDDIGELQQVPLGWSAQCTETEDQLALALLVNTATGAPNPDTFNNQYGNLGTGALTPENLQEAITQLTTKRDMNGRLLVTPALQLVVGPSLQFVAERIINTSELRVPLGDGSTAIQSNPFRGKVKLTVLPGLPGVSWFILPVPQAGRKNAFYVAKLRGFETPDLRAKADQGTKIGGGSLPVDSGSFNDDTIWFRVRHIVGAAPGDMTFTLASDGA